MKKMKQIFVFLTMFMLIFGSVQLLNVQAQDSDTETTDVESGESSDLETTTEPEDDDDEIIDDDDDGIDDEVEDKEEREIEYELNTENNELKLKSELKIGENKNKIEVELKAKEDFEIDFKYASETASVESDLRIYIEFKSFIEFVDNTTNLDNILGGYDNSDELIKEIEFKDIPWTMELVTNEDLGQIYYSINVTGTYQGASVTFMFYFATNFVVLDDATVLQPTAAKFDVIINNYAYDSVDSQLALFTKLKSQLKSEVEVDETEDEKDGVSKFQEKGLDFGTTDFTGFFSWVSTVDVDGVTEDIVSSPVVDDDEEISGSKVYFSFPHGDSIVWDPKVGVSRETTGTVLVINSPGASSVPGFEAISLVIFPLIGFIAIFLRRRN